MQMTVVENIVNAAKADIAELEKQLDEFSSVRINTESSTDEVAKRFPTLARETENEVKSLQYYSKD